MLSLVFRSYKAMKHTNQTPHTMYILIQELYEQMKLCNCKINVPYTTISYITVTDVSNWYFSSVNADDTISKVQSSV